MNRMKFFLSMMVAMMVCFGSVGACLAKEYKDIPSEATLLIVVDKSKESYGNQLKSEVYTQLEKQLRVSIMRESEVPEISKGTRFDKISEAEKPELLDLASQSGVKRVLVVEILPTKSDFREIIFYKAVQSQATIRVRVYDAVTKQYVFNEEVASTSINKTIIPYTFVGKKVTVLEAVHKAVTIIAQELNQKIGDY